MKPKRHPESGYALLFVFAMAATAAIMLYMELPRVAFEAQREKEQLLIDRGEQYSRAVQLFVRKNNRFPQDMDALENTQSIRFLRRRYTDPMTGKDDWRIIHVGPGGVFTDSLIYGKKKKDDQNAPQTFIAEMQQVGGTVSGPEGVNQATRRRPSEQAGAPGNPNNDPNGATQLLPGNPGGFPGNGQPFPGGSTISGPVMVLPDGRIVPASTTGQAPPPAQAPTPGQQNPNLPPGVQPPGGIGFQPGGQPGTQPGAAFPGQVSQNGLPAGFQTQPNGVGGPQGAAANIINQILTTPRPGGLNGIGGTGNTGSPIGQGLGGQTIGGGFAGVASKAEQEGIKSYKDHTSYNEWEFVYDMTKDASRTGGGFNPGQQGANPGANPSQPNGPSQPISGVPVK
jgi:hypothetical protein